MIIEPTYHNNKIHILVSEQLKNSRCITINILKRDASSFTKFDSKEDFEKYVYSDAVFEFSNAKNVTELSNDIASKTRRDSGNVIVHHPEKKNEARATVPSKMRDEYTFVESDNISDDRILVLYSSKKNEMDNALFWITEESAGFIHPKAKNYGAFKRL